MKTTELSCGCCGTWFKTWPEYIDQDQDLGYGICKRCQGSIEQSNVKAMDKAIATLAAGLSPTNRAKLKASSRMKQELLVHMALDEGVMTWEIGGRAQA